MSRKRTPRSTLNPIVQLEPGSYLARAFRDLAGGAASGSPSSSSSSSSSHSDPSDPSNGSPDPSSDDSASTENDRPRGKSRRVKKLKMKPEKPEPCDGRADAQVFHKFMRQTSEYVSLYDIPERMLASTVSNWLRKEVDTLTSGLRSQCTIR